MSLYGFSWLLTFYPHRIIVSSSTVHNHYQGVRPKGGLDEAVSPASERDLHAIDARDTRGRKHRLRGMQHSPGVVHLHHRRAVSEDRLQERKDLPRQGWRVEARAQVRRRRGE